MKLFVIKIKETNDKEFSECCLMGIQGCKRGEKQVMKYELSCQLLDVVTCYLGSKTHDV